MNFLRKIFKIGNRTLARTITEDFAKNYVKLMNEGVQRNPTELIKKTLSLSKFPAAQELLNDELFWSENDNPELGHILYLIVTESSQSNKKRLFILESNVEAYVDEIETVLKEFGIKKL
jgi:hypothetical protein